MKRIQLRGVALTSMVLALACAPGTPDESEIVAALFSGAGTRWIDMSYTYDESTIYWPTAAGFQLEAVEEGMREAGYYYLSNSFCTSEHGGTHLDAPIHFAAERQTTEQIPLERLIGPALVVDVADLAAVDPDYRVSAADLERWEAEHGRIAAGSILLLRTGWGTRWPDRAAYLGTDRRGAEAVAELHFPGLGPDAAAWLVENRRIDAIGIDTPSIDFGQSTTYESHRILYAENIPAFENVAALGQLPASGAYVIALPMKIGGGSGGPLRMVGVIPEGV